MVEAAVLQGSGFMTRDLKHLIRFGLWASAFGIAPKPQAYSHTKYDPDLYLPMSLQVHLNSKFDKASFAVLAV